MVRQNACEVLTAAGFNVLAAHDGVDALAILGACHGEVALLFTDVMMPRIDGLELVRQARHDWPWVPALVSSGKMTPTLSDLPAGSRFLPKPDRLAHLVANAREMVSHA